MPEVFRRDPGFDVSKRTGIRITVPELPPGIIANARDQYLAILRLR